MTIFQDYDPIYISTRYVLMPKLENVNGKVLVNGMHYAVLIKTRDRYYVTDFTYESFAGYIDTIPSTDI